MKYYILEFDMRYCINRVYSIYTDMSLAISKVRELNSSQYGLVPEYKYTLTCKK